MILSNEPGYYKTGAYGIRIENLELVVPADIAGAEKPTNKFETLTFAPIDRRLIETSLMAPDEVKWLNEYHAKVRELVSGALDEPTRAWLEAVTEKL